MRRDGPSSGPSALLRGTATQGLLVQAEARAHGADARGCAEGAGLSCDEAAGAATAFWAVVGRLRSLAGRGGVEGYIFSNSELERIVLF